MSYFDDFVKKVPDSINARSGANTRKLIRFLTDGMTDIRGLFQQVSLFRSVDNATGKSLDNLGEKYGQKRGPAEDEFYRIMIKSKIIIRAGDATVNGILRAIESSLSVSAKGVIVETLRYPLNQNSVATEEPLAIRITNIPLDVAKTEWEENYLMERIKSVVAAGVRVEYIQFVDTAGAVVKTVVSTNNAIIYNNDEPFD